MRRAQVDEAFDPIVEFSGVGAFIDRPVETYSSGMYVRLAFSVAVHTDPDVFLVDEVLAVGDEEFQRKCRQRIGELRESGKTIVFVSHDLGIVNALCDRVILLDRGRVVSRPTPRETIQYYLRTVGGEGGVHAMSEGDVEAVINHGRLSLFHAGHEVTAPAGGWMSLRSLESSHDSASAAWTVTEAGPTSCVGRGTMPRLPVTLVWKLNVEKGRLTWRAGVECERPTPIEAFDLHMHLPAGYAEWIYGDLNGVFPTSRPKT